MRIPCSWMRGGTSKGLFFVESDLPDDAAQRDSILMRAIGSPDPYGTQIDGVGGATPSTSKVVLVRKSSRNDADIEYRFGAVAIDRPFIDWTGNCGNLTTAVSHFALERGLIVAPEDGATTVRLWQADVGQRIDAKFEVRNGLAVESGDFMLDGVANPAAPVVLEFLDPASDPESAAGPMFPTGNVVDTVPTPFGDIQATFINAGAPTVFVSAAAFGLAGTESRQAFETLVPARDALVALRREGAVRMGIVNTIEQADTDSPHAPRIAFVAPAASYVASNGKAVQAQEVDLVTRILTLGKVHQSMTGTGAVALAVAAAVPGTVVSSAMGHASQSVVFGHPSGTLRAGAEVSGEGGNWIARKVTMTRSARCLMRGEVCVG